MNSIQDVLRKLSWSSIAIIAITLLLGIFTMGLFSRKNHFDVEGKTVLLTGASQGMGLSVAKILSAKGANLALVARNVGRLEEALQVVQAAAKSPSQKFQYFSADVTDPNEASRIVAEVTTWNHGAAPSIVWCIAGASTPGLFLETSTETLRSQMDLNYWAAADMARAILSSWLSPSAVESKEVRHLIFTASTLVFYPIVGYSPYSPAKAAMRALCDTLYQEIQLYSDTVKIHTVFPGSINTPGFEEENKTKPAITKILEEPDPVQTPDEVAGSAIRGLEKGEYFVTVNFLGQAMRACAWGGSVRNNWLVDTVLSWIVAAVWFFIAADTNGKVRGYGKKHGHPAAYGKA